MQAHYTYSWSSVSLLEYCCAKIACTPIYRTAFAWHKTIETTRCAAGLVALQNANWIRKNSSWVQVACSDTLSFLISALKLLGAPMN